ncbi:hypothetical protein BDZ97DRAFT_1924455 [Flammula alnicola]|nr:hypothetical protein BDZ97DRAFT_2084247 [Flammula alnicola]KAF8957570.1 hypothetical protein BDZ97DRAFT_1924455 [Flammula alnicola]
MDAFFTLFTTTASASATDKSLNTHASATTAEATFDIVDHEKSGSGGNAYCYSSPSIHYDNMFIPHSLHYHAHPRPLRLTTHHRHHSIGTIHYASKPSTSIPPTPFTGNIVNMTLIIIA